MSQMIHLDTKKKRPNDGYGYVLIKQENEHEILINVQNGN